VLGLGTTTVSCTVVDGGKLSVTDTFDVTVVDSTAPALTVPGDQSVTTSDPNGAAVEYGSVSATDIVDPRRPSGARRPAAPSSRSGRRP
jgi:hypothetical protein